MAVMNQTLDPLAPRALIYSWIVAVFGLLLSLVIAAVGQGVGGMLGGCTWIGVTTPAHQQVWALVNQPSMTFSRQAAATGYWLGSTILTLLVAALVVQVIPRARTLSAELLLLQVGWTCAAVGGGWLALLDTKDGHVSRWLYLHDAAPGLVWIIPVLALLAGLVPTVRLLALGRHARRDTGTGYRLGLVTLHLGLPVALWIILVTLVRGQLLIPATVAMLIPFAGALVLAWLRYPQPYAHHLEPIRGTSFTNALVLLLLVASLVGVTGRPLQESKASGLQWGAESSFNNIRPWVEPVFLAR
jgi:MFS family permease